MKICEKHQELAAQIGESIWVKDGNWYQVYLDADGEWSVHASWGSIGYDVEMHMLDKIVRQGTKIEQRHLDAIQRVDAPAEQVTVGVDWVQRIEDNDCATEDIIDNLIMARTVSDAETAIGYVRDAKTGDIFKVTIEYLGNNPDEQD